ncbi:MAG TPA: hypothetical protein VG797_07725 [Phycisphaerales bacterium]|nr:hypothetical protein [Phycisphaerales bacterium]
MTRNRGYFRTLFGLSAIFALACVPITIPGCAGGDAPEGVAASLGPAGPAIPGGPTRDLDPAVRAAVSDCSFAIIETSDLPGGRLYRLLDALDRPGWLRVDINERAPSSMSSGATTAPADYAAATKLGRFGDPEREKKLLERLKFHIERLKKQDEAKPRTK